MKQILIFFGYLFLLVPFAFTQVTQINSNRSLHVVAPLTNTKTIIVSDIDSSIWVSDASLPGTVQITTNIKFEWDYLLLSGKMIFRGSTAATGSEIYVTDGTISGTVLVKDIYAGTTGSVPAEMTVLNSFVYFTAVTATEGRELWRTNGTPAGTTLVKDIVTGTNSSNAENEYNLFSTGTYLLFAANSTAAGVELWKSDGTNAGTVLLKDINPGTDSSGPNFFYTFNGIVLFTATDATHGNELWKTDGTNAGTSLLKDIRVGTASSTELELFPGFGFPIFTSFHLFNNKLYFNATDGTSTGQIWSTDGTTANTTLLKNVVQSTSLPFVLVIDAVNYPNKFIFPVSDGVSRSELWVSDGTPAGTVLFKAFTSINPESVPFVFVPYNADVLNGTLSQPLFQGSKFFFTAGTLAAGNELWISDGTLAGTQMVKDIYTGSGDGINISNGISYLYTNSFLFFKGTTAALGDELWKSDGTALGTTNVADIYTNTGSSEPQLGFITNVNKIIFSATNGDDPDHTDLYVVDGNFLPVPVKLSTFTVMLKGADAVLNWKTLQESNLKGFKVERSFDGSQFSSVGFVPSLANSTNGNTYLFIDAGITNYGRSIAYYRLVFTDKDEKTTNSIIISVKMSPGADWDIKIAGNPVPGDLHVLLSGTDGPVKFNIIDAAGRLVYSKTTQNTNGLLSIPAGLQSGSYSLIAVYNNQRKTIRFIKLWRK